ncbi:MAG: hypothetical protein PHO06_02540 [Clostridia bacterium]|jgi:uncharacterized protein YacL|nr:hypothetical protein [Clostridia bacterium]
MEKKTKKIEYNKEEALNILSRIDGWINNCDTKFSIMLTLLGVFFGLTLSLFSSFSILRTTIENWEATILLDKIVDITSCSLVIIYIIFIILCTIFSIIGINAKIKNKNNNPIFFGNIAQNKNYKDFEVQIKKVSANEYLSLLNEQIFTNSQICTKKYEFYKKSLFCLLSAVLVAIITFILLAI